MVWVVTTADECVYFMKRAINREWKQKVKSTDGSNEINSTGQTNRQTNGWTDGQVGRYVGRRTDGRRLGLGWEMNNWELTVGTRQKQIHRT